MTIFLGAHFSAKGSGADFHSRTSPAASNGNESWSDSKAVPCAVLLAGGGFNHGEHPVFEPNAPPPLSNLTGLAPRA